MKYFTQDLIVRGQSREQLIHLAERVVNRREKYAPLQIDYTILNPIFRDTDEKPASRAAVRQVRVAV